MKTILFFFTCLIITNMRAFSQQTNTHFSYTDSTLAGPDKIWEVWTDVANWPEWDEGLREARITEGDFIKGATGKLTPDAGRATKFRIEAISVNRTYLLKARIPFGWLRIHRYLDTREGITYFTHEVQFTGPMKGLLGNKLGKRYRAMLPGVLRKIKTIAEAK